MKNPSRISEMLPEYDFSKGVRGKYFQLRQQNLRTKYGLSLEDYQKLLDNQKGVCAICKLPPEGDIPLYVDHCHTTNRVRGLLHNRCNLALGMLQDNPNLISRMKWYLYE